MTDIPPNYDPVRAHLLRHTIDGPLWCVHLHTTNMDESYPKYSDLVKQGWGSTFDIALAAAVDAIPYASGHYLPGPTGETVGLDEILSAIMPKQPTIRRRI